MELKIQCNCGTKYKFEFDPVDGRVPFAVICPTCATDATEFVNSQIPASKGAPAATTSVEATPVAGGAAPALRVSGHGATLATLAPVQQTAAPAPRAYAPPLTAYKPESEDTGLSRNFFLGLLGAALGVVVGCAIWYLIFHLTGKNFRLVALLVGIAGGFGAKLLSKDEGSSQLGMIAATFVLIGIMFTGYSMGRQMVHEFVGGIEGEIYKEEVAYAKRAVAAVPNGTEQEIRLFLAKEHAWSDETPDPAAVDRHEVRLFRDVQLPQYRELAAGKISEKDFPKVQRRWAHEAAVAEAKYALAAMPTESDREIRLYLAQEYADPGERPDPRAISAEEVAGFRAEVLPELKALAGGQQEFVDEFEDYKTSKEALTEFEESEEGAWVKVLYFFSAWGIGGLGIVCVTLGVAYKICANA